MTDINTPAATPSAPAAAPSQPTNYILYRTVNATYQPDSYQGPDGKTVVPPAVVSSPAGTVISTMTLVSNVGISMPDGVALAADPEGAYPINSIYTPPPPPAS